MITLFHGSNMDFPEISLGKCLPYKDFGQGFYLTPSYKRAQKRALDKVYKENNGVPVVQKYEFNEESASTLKVLKFDLCDEQWLNFILDCRNIHNKKFHTYDIVIGPVADDGVITSISLYLSKVITKTELLNRIKAATPYIQYAFCTERAIKNLTRTY